MKCSICSNLLNPIQNHKKCANCNNWICANCLKKWYSNHYEIYHECDDCFGILCLDCYENTMSCKYCNKTRCSRCMTRKCTHYIDD